MLWLAIVCVAVALTGAEEDEGHPVANKIFEYKHHAQHLFLEHLEEELSKLESEFAHLPQYPEQHEIDEMAGRLDMLEESDCEENSYRCGNGSDQCINELLFCDGEKDCFNGADENELCSGDMVKAGSSFYGLSTWESCESHHETMLTLTITEKKVNHIIGATVEVHASVSWEKTSKVASGLWHVGAEKLVLDMAGDDNLMITCHFFSHDAADCEVHKSSDETCATLRVYRG